MARDDYTSTTPLFVRVNVATSDQWQCSKLFILYERVRGDGRQDGDRRVYAIADCAEKRKGEQSEGTPECVLSMRAGRKKNLFTIFFSFLRNNARGVTMCPMHGSTHSKCVCALQSSVHSVRHFIQCVILLNVLYQPLLPQEHV